MGGICSCFHVPDTSILDNCYCPGCLFHKFKNKHVNIFAQRQRNSITSPNQQESAANPGLVFNTGERGRQESGICPLHVQPEQSGQSGVRNDTEILQGIIVSPKPVVPQQLRLKSYAKALSSGAGGFEHMFPSSNDVDECPTCLEEYTPENPKIMAKCSHHYHLSCIYEWMERNENCPVCGKLMLFDE